MKCNLQQRAAYVVLVCYIGFLFVSGFTTWRALKREAPKTQALPLTPAIHEKPLQVDPWGKPESWQFLPEAPDELKTRKQAPQQPPKKRPEAPTKKKELIA